MSVTINNQPDIHDNKAQFGVSTSYTEDNDHVNLRVEAELFIDGDKTAKSIKPKGLLDYDFTDILNSLIQFTIPDWKTVEGNDLIGVEAGGSNLITGWTNIDYDTLTTSGANITSAIHDGTVSGAGKFQSNSLSLVKGKIYVLRLSSYVSTGDNEPDLKSTILASLKGYFEPIGTGAGGVYYFLCKVNSTPKLEFACSATDKVNFLTNCELYLLDVNDWFKSYTMTFQEKWENASGVTQSGSAVSADEAFIHYRVPELTSSDFKTYYICNSVSDYALAHYRNIDGENRRGCYLFKTLMNVSCYATCIIDQSVENVKAVIKYYTKAGVYIIDSDTSYKNRHSPLYMIVTNASTFTDTKYRGETYIEDEDNNRIMDYYHVIAKGCTRSNIPVLLHWINLLGGIETNTFFGDYRMNAEVERETYKSTDRLPKNLRAFQRRRIDASSGYIAITDTHEYDRLYWESLLETVNAWYHIDEQKSVKITVTVPNILLNPANLKIWETKISFVYKKHELEEAEAAAEPVPQSYNLVGFGTNSKFAYASVGINPKIMVVDRLTTSTSDGAAYGVGGIDFRGSLPYCLTQNYPRIILFETSGTLDMKGVSYVDIEQSFCWVILQSAPSPGFEVIGCNIWIGNGVRTTDFLITDGTFGLGDISTQAKANNKDAMTIFDVDNVVMDHCAFKWGTDEIVSIGADADNVTLSNNLVYEGLFRSNRALKFDPEGSKPDGSAIAGKNVTYYRNLMAFTINRCPWFNASGFPDNSKRVIINNIFRNTWIRCGGEMGDQGDGNSTDIITIGNVSYRANDDFTDSLQDYCGIIRSGSIAADTKIYAKDLLCKYMDDHPGLDPNDPTDAFEAIYDNSGNSLSGETIPPFDISEYSPIAAALVTAYVLANSGPKYKDAHDLRIIDDVENNNDRDTFIEDNEYDTMDSLLNSPDALPARTIKWDQNTNGDVQNGYNFSVDNQTFDINVSINNGSNWSGIKSITLNTNCADENDIVTELNADFVTAGIDHLVEGFVVSHSDTTRNDRYVGIRTKETGKDCMIKIDNSTATAIDLNDSDAGGLGYPDDAYHGTDAMSGGYLSRTVNSRNFTIPANPHDKHPESVLTNLEVWILKEFGPIGDGYDY